MTPQTAVTLSVDALPGPVLVIDAHGTLLAANAPVCALLGCTQDALVGHGLSYFLPPSSRGSLRQAVSAVQATATTARAELHVLTGDGHTAEVHQDLGRLGTATLLSMTDLTPTRWPTGSF